tara:strand:- start:3607 stop:3930 length:324 start_codon:yes stop_codon:yes gene_type:complete
MELSEAHIQNILTTYKNKRIREKAHYHNVSKNSEEFKIKNRQRAKSHYERIGKDMKKDDYEINKSIYTARSLYNYYEKTDRIETFKEIHEIKYNLLIEKGLIKSKIE